MTENQHASASCHVAVVGMGVMGANLARNMERRGLRVALYNRTVERADEVAAAHPEARGLIPVHSPAELAAHLTRPRRVVLMVKAGKPVDATIATLLPFLDAGDVVVDGGNSHYRDTAQRGTELGARGILFMGLGVSGGERGALEGPSLMPGGSEAAWQAMEPILTAIAARADDGSPCCAHLGPGAAGHFVKMVHNGIEYADMQLIAEAYDLLRRLLDLDSSAIADVVDGWNHGPQASYLLEISARILRTVDPETGRPLVDLILDEAAQKGTGRWTVEAALELGVPVPAIAAALDARAISAGRPGRLRAAAALAGPPSRVDGDPTAVIRDLGRALLAGKVCAYAQGLSLLREASEVHGWDLDLAVVTRIWRAGCIIRARLLTDLAAAYTTDPALPDLRLAPAIAAWLGEADGGWRATLARATSAGVAAPALSATLAWHDATRAAQSPANLIQAQRDCFGAHTYQRLDRPGIFHTDWETDEGPPAPPEGAP